MIVLRVMRGGRHFGARSEPVVPNEHLSSFLAYHDRVNNRVLAVFAHQGLEPLNLNEGVINAVMGTPWTGLTKCFRHCVFTGESVANLAMAS